MKDEQRQKTEAEAETTGSLSSLHPSSFILHPSGVRAWCYLIWLSWLRQARARQMVWIALALMALAVTLVAFNTALGRWGLHYGRLWPRDLWADEEHMAVAALTLSPTAHAIEHAIFGAARAVHDGEVIQETAFTVFSYVVVFEVFLSFLLPMWSL